MPTPVQLCVIAGIIIRTIQENRVSDNSMLTGFISDKLNIEGVIFTSRWLEFAGRHQPSSASITVQSGNFSQLRSSTIKHQCQQHVPCSIKTFSAKKAFADI